MLLTVIAAFEELSSALHNSSLSLIQEHVIEPLGRNDGWPTWFCNFLSRSDDIPGEMQIPLLHMLVIHVTCCHVIRNACSFLQLACLLVSGDSKKSYKEVIHYIA
jgi:hypothetical protein